MLQLWERQQMAKDSSTNHFGFAFAAAIEPYSPGYRYGYGYMGCRLYGSPLAGNMRLQLNCKMTQ